MWTSFVRLLLVFVRTECLYWHFCAIRIIVSANLCTAIPFALPSGKWSLCSITTARTVLLGTNTINFMSAVSSLNRRLQHDDSICFSKAYMEIIKKFSWSMQSACRLIRAANCFVVTVRVPFFARILIATSITIPILLAPLFRQDWPQNWQLPVVAASFRNERKSVKAHSIIDNIKLGTLVAQMLAFVLNSANCKCETGFLCRVALVCRSISRSGSMWSGAK